MKTLIAAVLLAATCGRAGDTAPIITPGVTNRLDWDMWVCAANVAQTNMTDVVFFERRPTAPTPRIVKAKTADIDLTDPAILRLNLRDVTFEESGKDGLTRTIRAHLYPIRIDRRQMEKLWREYGAQSGSPFEQVKVSHEPVYYPAQKDDTIDTIVALFGVSQKQLLGWNPALLTNTVLTPGQKILIGSSDEQ